MLIKHGQQLQYKKGHRDDTIQIAVITYQTSKTAQ